MNPQEKINRLKKIIEEKNNHTGCFNVIITQIDPDALGSAFGLKYILSKLGAQRIRILYCGKIGHEQNRAIIYRYNLEERMSPLTNVQASFTESDYFCFVDSSSTLDERLGAGKGKIEPIIVIDHHQGSNITPKNDNFVWVEEIGSCSTLLVELMSSMENGFDFSTEREAFIPILLSIGIYTDTKNMIKSSVRDIQAYSKIGQYANQDELQKIINYQLSPAFFDCWLQALQAQKTDGSRLVTSVGHIANENADVVSGIADLLIRKANTTLVVVWGIVDHHVVRLSARSTDASMPLNEFLKKHFGSKAGAKIMPDGSSEGGGLVELNLEFWSDRETEKEVLTLITKKLSFLILES